MVHVGSLSSKEIATRKQYQPLQDSERTEIAFASALAAITAVNTVALVIILVQCGNGRCPAADISCTDVAIATTWVALGGMIGKTISLPNFKHIQFTTPKEKQQLEDFKKKLVKIASASSALAFQGLFKMALGLIKCSERQTREGNAGQCYETNIAFIHGVSVIGLLGLAIVLSPHVTHSSPKRSLDTILPVKNHSKTSS